MWKIFSITICYIYILSATEPHRNIKDNKASIEGFVTHGINNFNGHPIVDIASDGYGYIFQNGPYEQQVLNPDSEIATKPDDTTNRDELLSTGRDFTLWFKKLGFATTPNPFLFNIPYLDIGVTTAASINIDDRKQLVSFQDTDPNPTDVYPNTYYPKGALTKPTLGDWEKASGLIEAECDTKNNEAMVSVTICGMLPSSIYTVWEVGVENPGKDETFYSHPAGGVGNVIRTNLNGFGELEFKMPWCPLRECVPDTSKDCQIYFSVFHHSDYTVYGGDSGGITWKPDSYPPGIIGASHLWFPLKGTFLQQPLNRFHPQRCKKNGGIGGGHNSDSYSNSHSDSYSDSHSHSNGGKPGHGSGSHSDSYSDSKSTQKKGDGQYLPDEASDYLKDAINQPMNANIVDEKQGSLQMYIPKKPKKNYAERMEKYQSKHHSHYHWYKQQHPNENDMSEY